MALQVGGLISGLDTHSLISQLISLERRPIELLETREDAFNVKLTAFGEVKSKLGTFQSAVEDLADASSFSATTTTSSNEDILTVSGSNDAQPADHSIVVKSLAQAHAVRSGAFADKDDVVGTGTISIHVGAGTAVDVVIASGQNTLSGIADAINKTDAGVSASVVDDGTGNVYLALMSEETGADNTVSITIDDDDLVDNDASGLSALYNDPAAQTMFQTKQALNSTLTFNGIDVERASNVIDDLIEGVTLTLHEADAAKTVNVKVTQDIDSIKEKINAFVNAYNSVADDFADKQESLTGALSGDYTLRNIERRLRSLYGSSVDGITSAYNTMAGIGITAGQDGKLTLDDDALTEALNTGLDDVTTLFAADSESVQGIAVSLNSYMDDVLDTTDGLIVGRENGLQDSIDDIQKKQESMEMRIAKREERLWQQFNSLELLLGTYQQTSSYLSMQLSSLASLNKQIYG